MEKQKEELSKVVKLNLIVGIEQILKSYDPFNSDPQLKRITDELSRIHNELVQLK